MMAFWGLVGREFLSQLFLAWKRFVECKQSVKNEVDISLQTLHELERAN